MKEGRTERVGEIRRKKIKTEAMEGKGKKKVNEREEKEMKEGE